MRLPYHKITKAFIAALLIASGCKKENPDEEVNYTLTPYSINYPAYFPDLIIPETNPLTVEGIQLGRKLYYDPILSNTGLSCSSCHEKSSSFSMYSINSLPHINLGWNSNFLWNGKISGSLEDIMRFEVEEFFSTDVSKLNNSSEYLALFKKIYGVDNITSKEVAYALAQFFRYLTSFNSPFDKFANHEITLSSSELNGFVIFNTEKGDCFHCHSLGLFTDNKFHNNGLDSTYSGVNMGRYNVTGNPADIGAFKSPTLRNIEFTAPYMHDGRFTTLEEVVEFYNSQVKFSSTVDPIMTKPSKEFGLQLTPTEKTDLVNFLKTLSDSSFINNPNY